MASFPTTMRRYTSSPFAILHLLFDLLQLLLALRFILRLFGAGTGATFTRLVYGLSAPFTAPFAGIFPTTSAQGLTVEWSTLVAMIAYALLAAIVFQLLTASFPSRTVRHAGNGHLDEEIVE